MMDPSANFARLLTAKRFAHRGLPAGRQALWSETKIKKNKGRSNDLPEN